MNRAVAVNVGKITNNISRRRQAMATQTGIARCLNVGMVLAFLYASAVVAEPEKELTLDLGSGVTMKLNLIPAGKYMRRQVVSDVEKDPYEITISKPMYVGVTEVTQAQYEQIMGTNPSTFKGATNPIEMVSSTQAMEFCKKVSEKTGQKVRLPTEAEWEYACRAGTQTQFSFGDDLNALKDYGWYSGNSDNKTHPVGLKKPNPWGLYDMHGNVWEWVSDWYGDYAGGALTDPQGGGPAACRPLRGGAYDCTSDRCGSADRSLYHKSHYWENYPYYGFRAVASVSAAGLNSDLHGGRVPAAGSRHCRGGSAVAVMIAGSAAQQAMPHTANLYDLRGVPIARASSAPRPVSACVVAAAAR